MKNLSFGLNIILLIAVLVLYYLHFTGNASALSGSNTTDPVLSDESSKIEGDSSIANGQIAYIDVDSLHSSYKYYSDLVDKLKLKQKKYERELAAKGSSFEKKYKEFREKAPTMSQFEGQMKQEELALEEEKLYKMREDFSLKFKAEEGKLNSQFQKKIKDFLEELNREAGYTVILGGGSEMGCLILDYQKTIDITKEVVEGLNGEYEQQEKTDK